MEEDFWSHESLMTNVDFKLFLCNIVESGVVLDPLDDISFVFSELLGDIWTDVAKSLFDCLPKEFFKEKIN